MNVVCIRFTLWLRGSRTPSGTQYYLLAMCEELDQLLAL